MEMSTVNELGVAEVKIEACDRLLAHRIENKIKTKKVNEVMNRLTVRKCGLRLPFFSLPPLPPVMRLSKLAVEIFTILSLERITNLQFQVANLLQNLSPTVLSLFSIHPTYLYPSHLLLSPFAVRLVQNGNKRRIRY